MNVQSENEYEDLLSLWSDLESGLGIILSSPGSNCRFGNGADQLRIATGNTSGLIRLLQ